MLIPQNMERLELRTLQLIAHAKSPRKLCLSTLLTATLYNITKINEGQSSVENCNYRTIFPLISSLNMPNGVHQLQEVLHRKLGRVVFDKVKR
ncbi:hypothetical protein TNCV_1098201 [Trichonephila clavipes]|nr:hypothetical protein TNCV_1098201 [Trichonephila clavipes]